MERTGGEDRDKLQRQIDDLIERAAANRVELDAIGDRAVADRKQVGIGRKGAREHPGRSRPLAAGAIDEPGRHAMTDTTHKSSRTNSTPRSNGRTTGIQAASPQQWLGSNDDPDVMLSVPDVSVDKIALKVKELRADVDLQARVLDLLDLRVGARVTLGEVDLEIDNIRAQAMLKVRLDSVAAVVAQVMQVISANPELVTNALNISVAADPVRGVPPETRTVRGASLAGVLSGSLGAKGAEAQVDAVQAVHRVEHGGDARPKRAPRKSATKRVPHKSATTRARRART